MPEQNINDVLSNPQLKNFLAQFTGEVKPTPKPHWHNEVRPVWSDHIILGADETKDIRYYTQFKIHIKPPVQRYPNPAVMLTMIGGGKATYVRLNSVDELRALLCKMSDWIPVVEKHLEDLKPLSDQIKAANAAYDIALRASDNGEPSLEE